MLVSPVLTYRLTKNNQTTALDGTWVGKIGYFGTILFAYFFTIKLDLALKNKSHSLKTFGLNIRALFIEFGVAEFFESSLIRPTLLYCIPIWVNDIPLGIIFTNFTADITFYVQAVISYELYKKKLRGFE
jgi:hypothetical protein